jgi:hypothetical protein
VAEVKYVDARLPVVYGFTLMAGAAWLAQSVFARTRLDRDARATLSGSAVTWRLLAVFWVVSFVIWTQQFSIHRYIVPLSVLSGALLVTLMRHLLRPRIVTAATVAVAAALIASTSPPDWWRVDFGRRWFDMEVPWVAPNALVLLTSDAPMAHVLPFFPADARHFGLNNNINDPQRDTLMEDTIVRAIREHTGPMYSLSFPAGTGDAVLMADGMFRVKETCALIRTKMRTSPMELCRVIHFPPR